jgi:hypothetical protein
MSGNRRMLFMSKDKRYSISKRLSRHSWAKDGSQHRDYGPAIINSDGTRCWYHNGKRHRNNRPAIVYLNGDKFWWQHGVTLNQDILENFQEFTMSINEMIKSITNMTGSMRVQMRYRTGYARMCGMDSVQWTKWKVGEVFIAFHDGEVYEIGANECGEFSPSTDECNDFPNCFRKEGWSGEGYYLQLGV